jgi:uncharacterized Tic20 family protein
MPSASQDDRNMALLLHLLSIVIGFISPLIFYLVKKDSPFVLDHAREALNFHISMFIYWFVAGILVIVLIGLPMMLVLGALQLILPIIAAVKAAGGEPYRYPMAIRFLKAESL